MKFITESAVRCGARLGILSDLERLPDIILETPLLLFYTKRGSVPHLTKDVLKTLTSEHHLLSISLPSTLTMVNFIKGHGIPFAEFVSLKEYPMFMTIQDPAECTIQGAHELNSVTIWCKQGKRLLTPDSYMDLVETFQPDIYVALCDGDTNRTSSSRRVTKAVQRSNIMLETCLKRHCESNILKQKAILGAIEGGYDLRARDLSIEYLKGKPLAGFIIDGLHNNGPEVEEIPSEQIKDVVRHTINSLPADKLRVSMGGWNPSTVVDLIELGVDVFDSSYPYLVTERSHALIFSYDEHSSNTGSSCTMSVAEKRYADDFTPIYNSCKCLTCLNHTRAYLHHLCHTKELLGLVLLMIHNMHHYLQFFKAIRENLRNGTFHEFQRKIHLQFPNDQLI